MTISVRSFSAVLLLSACLVTPLGHAAQSVREPEAPELAAHAPQTKEERVLVGRWSTGPQTVDGTTPGEVELRFDGTMRLSPEGFEPVEGVWRATPATGTLALTVPDVGTSEMSYQLKSERLVLRYANGVSQTFSKLPEGKAATTRPSLLP
jgi:hypothetical protein